MTWHEFNLTKWFRYLCYDLILGDINGFDLPKEEFYGQADRVISIEMFEHMKNYELLLEKISNWLKPEGKVTKSKYRKDEIVEFFGRYKKMNEKNKG